MTVVNLPINFSETTQSNGLIWKQLIPMDKEIVYGDKKMKFDRDMLTSIVKSFDAHVFDQTAFQLADDQNRHDTESDIAANRNWDPERYRGDIEQLKIDDKEGLMMGLKPTPEGLELIKKNQKLGVSASIKPDYVDSDGKVHKYVLRHVAGTLNPKIKGMSPWKLDSITLSETDEDNEEVFDLTTTEPAPTNTDNAETVSVSKAEYDQMKKSIEDFGNGEALLDQILAEADDDDVTPGQNTNLSDTEPQDDPRITALQNDVAASKWQTERERYVHAGVPAGMLNLCDDIMSVHASPVINLSDGNTADPRETIKKLLEEAKGYVDLSDEGGHGYTPDERKAEREAAEQFADGFINEFNIGLFN